MADKQTYWIADVNGRHALVVGAEQRDRWVRIHGWRPAAEPVGDDVQVCIFRAEGGLHGQVPFGALDGWAEGGWVPGPPAEPVDLTRDPAPAKQMTEKTEE
jgi:hypothetical protein